VARPSAKTRYDLEQRRGRRRCCYLSGLQSILAQDFDSLAIDEAADRLGLSPRHSTALPTSLLLRIQHASILVKSRRGY